PRSASRVAGQRGRPVSLSGARGAVHGRCVEPGLFPAGAAAHVVWLLSAARGRALRRGHRPGLALRADISLDGRGAPTATLVGHWFGPSSPACRSRKPREWKYSPRWGTWGERRGGSRSQLARLGPIGQTNRGRPLDRPGAALRLPSAAVH